MVQTKKNRPRIVVVGSLVFDCVAQAERLPRKGETLLGTSFGMFSGGKGANQAVQAGRLGAEVYMVGRVGDDFRAEHLLPSLRQSGVNTDFVKKDPSAATGACCIYVDANGDNSIIIVPQANLKCSNEDVDAAREVIDSADVVLCQLEIPISTVTYAAKVATDRRIPFILNPAPAPTQTLPEELLRKTTMLTPNETEAESLSGIPLPGHGAKADATAKWESDVCRRLLAMGPQTVIITLGERGACLATDKSQRMISAYKVKAVDVTAAGDAFNGALAVALGEGKDIEAAIAFANAAGALAATRAGAQPSLATRSELEEFLRK